MKLGVFMTQSGPLTGPNPKLIGPDSVVKFDPMHFSSRVWVMIWVGQLDPRLNNSLKVLFLKKKISNKL